MNIHQLLKSHQLKITPARVVILELLQNTSDLLTADDIFDSINKKSSSDRATIYRTLSTFEKNGIVETVQLKDGRVRYELAHEHGHHHHAVCTECGTIEHIADDATERMLQTMTKKLKKFKTIQEHTLEFFGCCEGCAKGSGRASVKKSAFK